MSSGVPEGFSRRPRIDESIIEISDEDEDDGVDNRNLRPVEYNEEIVKQETKHEPPNELVNEQEMSCSDTASDISSSAFTNISATNSNSGLNQQIEQLKQEFFARLTEQESKINQQKSEMDAQAAKIESLERELKQANKKRKKSRSRSRERSKRKEKDETNHSRQKKSDKSNHSSINNGHSHSRRLSHSHSHSHKPSQSPRPSHSRTHRESLIVDTDQQSCSSTISVTEQMAFDSITMDEESSTDLPFGYSPITIIQGATEFERRPIVPRLQSQQFLRNINADYYQPKSKNCLICGKCFTWIVNHYKKSHRGQEVFISRLSRSMSDKAKANIFNASIVPGKFRKIEATCFFCQHSRIFTLAYWLDHLRIHTGEYAYKCQECCLDVSSHRHCGLPTIPVETYSHNLYVSDFNGYICNECNFVQLDENNMKRHIEFQHEIQLNQIEGQYQQITLLPSLRRLIYNLHAIVPASATQQYSQPNQRIQILEDILIPPSTNCGGVVETNDIECDVSINPNESDFEGNTRKREVGWSDSLKECKEHYYSSEIELMYNVKPWIVTENSKKSKIQMTSQFAFYKCMHPQCLFATNMRENMFGHLGDHLELIDIIRNDGEEEPIKHCLTCPYCDAGPFKTSNPFLDHMQIVHGQSNFQCKYCFYRCVEMDAIILHYDQFHGSEPNEVLVCNTETKKMLTYDMMEQMLMRKAEGIEINEHTKDYECSFCDNMNDDNLIKIREHIAMKHPNEFMFVLRRTSMATDNYLYIGGSLNSSSFKFLKSDNIYSMNSALSNYAEHSFDQDPTISEELQLFEPNKWIVQDGADLIKYQKCDNNTMYYCNKYAPEDFIRQYRFEKSTSTYQNQMCKICDKFIKIRSSGENDEFIVHMNGHAQDHCYYSHTKENQMLNHIALKHPDKINFYRKKCCYTDKIITKLFKSTYECVICSEINDKVKNIEQHFYENHPYELIDVHITRKITDIKTNVVTNAPERFIMKEVFHCGKKNCKKAINSGKSKLLLHHSTSHPNEPLEFRIKKVIQFLKYERQLLPRQSTIKMEDRNLIAKYCMTYKCLNCNKVMDSHSDLIEHKNDHLNERIKYSIQKLVGCAYFNCFAITTHDAIVEHYKKEHPKEKTYTICSMNNPNACGVCNRFENDRALLQMHYKNEHTSFNFDDETMELLIPEWKNDNQQIIYYIPACCKTECSQIIDAVEHYKTCKKRFQCSKCPHTSFSIEEAALHKCESLLVISSSKNAISLEKSCEIFGDVGIVVRMANKTDLVLTLFTIANCKIGNKVNSKFYDQLQKLFD